MAVAEIDPRLAVTIRDGTASDMPAVADIYAHEVRHGFATFEETPPGVEEMKKRWQAIVDLGLPYLVAELDGRTVGYCYASVYRPRPAYRHTVENTVYVAQSARGRGVATALLRALIGRCEAIGRRQMVAVIAIDGNEASTASIQLHDMLGFRKIGTLQASGFKFGQWVDTVLMQRALGNGANTLP